MPRYAVLEHAAPSGLHWDLLLQWRETLKTWALPEPPAVGKSVLCDALPDHRPIYLEYEGPVSGDRGEVARWDSGTYAVCRRSVGEWIVRLSGERLHGRAVLSRVADEPTRWRFSLDDGGA